MKNPLNTAMGKETSIHIIIIAGMVWQQVGEENQLPFYLNRKLEFTEKKLLKWLYLIHLFIMLSQ